MMSRKCILMYAFTFITSCAFSQDTAVIDIKDLFKINFYQPGISYEKRIGHLQSLYINPHLYLGLSPIMSDVGTPEKIYFAPEVFIQYRYYFNASQRQRKARETAINNLNYFAVDYEVLYSNMPITQYSEEPSPRFVHTFAIVWGMQRNYKKHFSLGLEFGPGYTFTKETSDIEQIERIFTIVGNLTLGFWLSGRHSTP